MELFEAIFNRRTIRKFKTDSVELEKVMEILEAGTYAPSSGNLQNWKFIIVTDKEKLRALYESSLEQEVFYHAQIGIIVCGESKIAEEYYGLRGKRLYMIQNCAAAIQNMLLAAKALGLGACWVGAFDEEKVDLIFDIPEEVRAQAIILLGYPDEKGKDPERKPLEEVVFFGKYGEKLRAPHLKTLDLSEEWARQFKNIKYRIEEKKKELKNKKPKRQMTGIKEKLKKAVKSLKK